MKPRTLWACQEVASMISARVAPLARRSRSRMVAVLLPTRAPSAFGFAAFGALTAGFAGGRLLGLGDRGGLGFGGLGAFLALGRALLRAGSLLSSELSRAQRRCPVR